MLKETRHDYILNEVRIRNRVLLSDLAQHLEVSEDTVRRDLKNLHDQGKLKKVHGGAVARSFVPFSLHQEEIYDHANKEIIARKALPLLSNGQVILITGGTTDITSGSCPATSFICRDNAINSAEFYNAPPP